MPMRSPVTASEIDTATRATIAALKSLNLDCCLVGSVACSAYGMSRVPNDIDMVVLTSEYTQEELKDRLVRYNERFYLVASKDLSATYRILWFRLDGFHRSCKIDLLFPGIMNIPSVATKRIYRVGRDVANSGNYLSYLAADYPLMPFLPLLLLKLQAWQDHGESTKLYMRTKQPTDVQDIRELLQLAERRYAISTSTRNVRYDGLTQSLLDREIPYLPDSFVRDARVRVRKFMRLHPWSAKQWKSIGFEVETGVRDNVRGLESMRGLEGMMRSLALDY